MGYVGYGRATEVTALTLDGRRPDGQEDLGILLQLNCSQEARVIADHFARTTASGSTAWRVVNAVCDSGPVPEEF